MGMPACRISDTTAHGGIVTVGFPTVLIGFLPASRIGDLHTCPMSTGPVPHVGGPFILGSPTVLVGMMPQSRVTDQLVCVGPPDVALKGEPTVLVGMAGAGGVMSASAGVVAMGASVLSAAPPSVGGGSPAAAGTQPATPMHASTAAQLQSDGTTRTLAAAGQGLPPIELSEEGWPTLPPEATCCFQSVQPANVLPGTTLYALTDADATPGANSFWTADPPAAATPSDPWNSGSHVLVFTLPPQSAIKAWAGQSLVSGKLAVWMPPASALPAAIQRFRMGGA